MSRRSGHLIGVNPSSSSSAASGIWGIRDVTARVRGAAWPSPTPPVSFVAIPSMTSLTSPSGTVTLVSNNPQSVADAWKLFDGVAPTTTGDNIGFYRFSYNNPQRYLAYQFAGTTKSNIGGYYLRQGINSSGGAEGQALHWYFQGSDDGGATWTTLDTRTVDYTNNGWSAGEARNYYLAAAANYNAYRWLFDDANDSAWQWCAAGLLQ
jgi:hypothetical protein